MKKQLAMTKIAKGLGAERGGKVRAKGGYFGAMELLADLEARFPVGRSAHGVLTKRPGALTSDYFASLLDMGIPWTPVTEGTDVFEGRHRTSGERLWTATRVDLVFGSNAILRGLAEVYASADAEGKFVRDFVKAWTTVMNLDRFDVATCRSGAA